MPGTFTMHTDSVPISLQSQFSTDIPHRRQKCNHKESWMDRSQAQEGEQAMQDEDWSKLTKLTELEGIEAF